MGIKILLSLIKDLIRYLLKSVNFIYYGYYTRIKSFKESYYGYYIINISCDGNTVINAGGKRKPLPTISGYEYILCLDDYELYNCLNKFGMIKKDDVYITINDNTEVIFNKNDVTNISGDKIVLIYDSEIYSEINIKTIDINGIVTHTQGKRLNKIPFQHVQYLDVEKLVDFNLLTCIELWVKDKLKPHSYLMLSSFLFLTLWLLFICRVY